MELIVLSRRRRIQRAVHLGPRAVAALVLLLLTGVGGAYWLGTTSAPVRLVTAEDPRPDLLAASMAKLLAEQRRAVLDARSRAETDLDALAQRLSELQARAIRIDALGARLVDMVGLDPQEFSFDAPPARGGPAPADSGGRNEVPDFLTSLAQLSDRLASRVQELEVLEKSLLEARLAEQMHPAGRPISVGWISSVFGWRHDPLTGRRSFHEGLDFAGRPGSPIFAAAAGIVTFSGTRNGFGHVVDVDHGRGFVTRYAHNRRNLVKRGDRVSRGQKIALMGASGRATGTHLHFEVLKDGKPLNPMAFLREQTSGSGLAEGASGS